MIHPAAVIPLVLCGANQYVIVPLIVEESDIADREINILVFLVADKGGKAVVIAPDIHEFPPVQFAEGTKIIDILCLKGLVVFTRINARTECVGKILAKFV